MTLPPFQIIDKREQKPYKIEGSVFGKLETGDYSVAGLENYFAIERKTREDIWISLTKGRERFKDEMKRARKFLAFIVVIECSPDIFIRPDKAGRLVHPNSLIGTIRSWRKYYDVEWVFLETADHGRRYVEWKLRQWYEEYKAGLWIPLKNSAECLTKE